MFCGFVINTISSQKDNVAASGCYVRYVIHADGFIHTPCIPQGWQNAGMNKDNKLKITQTTVSSSD